MTTTASIILIKNQFIATLSDGQHFENSNMRALAEMLGKAGVKGCNVSFDWNGSSGQRMITAGQQVAIRAEMRHFEMHPAKKNLAVAA